MNIIKNIATLALILFFTSTMFLSWACIGVYNLNSPDNDLYQSTELLPYIFGFVTAWFISFIPMTMIMTKQQD